MKIYKIIFISILFLFYYCGFSQYKNKKIQFIGGFGISLNSQFFSISLQPGGLYHISNSFKIGAALQYAYAKSKRNYFGVNFSRHMYGGNVFGLYYPLKEIEISTEYEILQVNEVYNSINRKYLSPAFFGGIGYKTKSFSIGLKYNFMHNENSIYKDALIPYARIYF